MISTARMARWPMTDSSNNGRPQQDRQRKPLTHALACAIVKAASGLHLISRPGAPALCDTAHPHRLTSANGRSPKNPTIPDRHALCLIAIQAVSRRNSAFSAKKVVFVRLCQPATTDRAASPFTSRAPSRSAEDTKRIFDKQGSDAALQLLKRAALLFHQTGQLCNIFHATPLMALP